MYRSQNIFETGGQHKANIIKKKAKLLKKYARSKLIQNYEMDLNLKYMFT